MTGTGHKVAQVARDRAVEHSVSKLMLLVPPWAGMFLLVPAAVLLHRAFDAWWAAAGVAVAAMLLAGLAVRMSHDRSPWHRLHLAGTFAAVAGYLIVADLFGFTRGTWFAWFLLGSTAALSWNIRHGARHAELGTLLGHVLAGAHESAGLEGVSVTVAPSAPGSRVIKGRVRGVPGTHTAKDIADKTAHVESAAGLPPGALGHSGSEDDRGVADFTLSDPRGLRDPIPWPGPSAPGASIVKPIRPGLWQTGDPVLAHLVPVSHWIIAGMTGSAKSTGWGWSILAELITRTDVDVYGLDPEKGEQTLGPFRDCFATDAPGCETGLLTDPAKVEPFLTWIRGEVRPRADFLAARGLQAWQEGCGLRLKIVWIEEAPDTLDHASDDAVEEWVKSLKQARTAGIMFVYSCQRPDWSQMPTIARAQFAGRIACGVNTDGDADLCMTRRQDKAGCEPEQWADRKPGMAYLDDSWVTDAQVTQAARAYYWGGDSTLIIQHARAFTRTDTRDGDDMRRSGRHAAPTLVPDPDPADENATRDELAATIIGRDDDPIDEADGPEIDPAGDWAFGDPGEPSGEGDTRTARQVLDDWLADRLRAGDLTFRPADLVELRAQVDKGRGWLYDELNRRAALGQLTHGDRGAWQIVRAA